MAVGIRRGCLGTLRMSDEHVAAESRAKRWTAEDVLVRLEIVRAGAGGQL
jgi:hypothetical protein